MLDVEAELGRPLARDLSGLARVIHCGTLVVGAEIAACRDIAAVPGLRRSWRELLDPGIATLGEAIGALVDGGPAAFWAEAEAIANTMSAEGAVRAGGTA